MRTYLESKKLASTLRANLDRMGKSQNTIAKELKISQGQLSHLLAGHFKTANPLVRSICKYANIDVRSFICSNASSQVVDRNVLGVLQRACSGSRRKAAVVVRVLRALENLDCNY